jgi:hypothetical protein
LESIVEHELEPLYTPLWILHREQFQEILKMKGKSVKGLTIDVRGAIEEIGLGRVIQEVGLDAVIREVGLDAIISAVGAERLQEALRQHEEQSKPKRTARRPKH